MFDWATQISRNQLDFSFKFHNRLPGMNKPASFRHFALYGETDQPIAPEFVHIEPISQRSSLHEWTIAPHAHRGIDQLLLLTAGSGILATEGEEAQLEAGTLILLPSGCVHAFRFATDAEGWVLSLASDLLHDPRISGASPGLLSSSGGPGWLRLADFGDKGPDTLMRLEWLLADLAGVLSDDRSGVLPGPVAAQIALVLAIAGQAMQGSGAGAETVPAPRQAQLALRFRQLVELHFRDGWSVADYANRLGATAQTLTRHCRAEIGKAPGEVVLDRILLEAMRKLTYSAAPVSSIAEDLGFADTAYFARFFKARSGSTASRFRRERSWIAKAADLPWLDGGEDRGEGG